MLAGLRRSLASHGLNSALAAIAIVAVVAACSRTTEQADGNRLHARAVPRSTATSLRSSSTTARAAIARSKTAAFDAACLPSVGAADPSDDPICVAGAPFSVLDYDSVRRHARAIASAVQRRAMPPWLPEPGHGEFAGERRLRDDQIALIAKWVESGAPEGNPADAPKPPTFSGGWQLGTPDLVLTLPEAYVLQPREPATCSATSSFRCRSPRRATCAPSSSAPIAHRCCTTRTWRSISGACRARSIVPSRVPVSRRWTAVRCTTCTAGRRARCR